VTIIGREPSTDELASVEWWNSLSAPRQADWLRLADSTKPAEEWAEYKRRTAEGLLSGNRWRCGGDLTVRPPCPPSIPSMHDLAAQVP